MDIKNRIIKTDLVEWRKLEWLQGTLKNLDKAEYEKLKTSIKNNGFICPFHIWKSRNKTYILDGHHRKRIMEDLGKEGLEIPKKLPANFVNCKNVKEAKKFVLLYASIFAKATYDSLYEYIHASELDFQDLKSEIDLPELNMGTFEVGWMKEKDFDEPSCKSKTEKKCPQCGYVLGKP